MLKWSIIAILLLPVAEIAAFVGIAAIMGLTGAFALMLLTSLAGFLVLRHAGRGGIARLRRAVDEPATLARAAGSSGIMTLVAGTLLLLPGFLTDLIGAALLIAPVRRSLGRLVRQWLRRESGGDGPTVIDLPPTEWRHVPDAEIESGSKKRSRKRSTTRRKPSASGRTEPR